MTRTWKKIKQEIPVVFTAAAVSLLATTISSRDSLEIMSKEFLNLIFNCIISSLIAIGIIYTILWLFLVKLNRD